MLMYPQYSASFPGSVACHKPTHWAPPELRNFAPIVPISTSFYLNSQSDEESIYSSSAGSSPEYESPLRAHPAYPTYPTHTLGFECRWKECGMMFKTLECLSVHLSRSHSSSGQGGLYYCSWDGCVRANKGFNARYKMLVHVRTHTNEKPHTCQLCHKSFSRAENLKIHTRSHSGEKPYVCTVEGCNKAYSNSSDRFKHMRTHSVDKPYNCKVPGCEKRYTDPSSLRKHVKTFKHPTYTFTQTKESKIKDDTYTSEQRVPVIVRNRIRDAKTYRDKGFVPYSQVKMERNSEIYENIHNRVISPLSKTIENDLIRVPSYQMPHYEFSRMYEQNYEYYNKQNDNFTHKLVSEHMQCGNQHFCFDKETPPYDTMHSYEEKDDFETPRPELLTSIPSYENFDIPLNLTRYSCEGDRDRAGVCLLGDTTRTLQHCRVELPLDLSKKN